MDTDHVVETYSWKLQVPAPPRLQEIGARNAFEAVVDMDHRTQVSSNDLEVNGTYRSIIKLKIAWQGAVKKRVWATGWLIRDDIVITAAHVVYQTDTFATEVRAHVGDNGADSIQGLQRRYGSRVVIPCAWQDSQEVVHDFAFVLLQGPFDHVVPLPYELTPSAGLNDIGVVGYPADKPGKQMYMEFRQVDCSLFEEGQPLAYGISTFRGNSGSPVLLKKGGRLIAIGTHSCFDEKRNLNRASPITSTTICPYSDIIKYLFGGNWPLPEERFGNFELHSVPV